MNISSWNDLWLSELESWLIYNWIDTRIVWDIWFKLSYMQKEWTQVVFSILNWNHKKNFFFTNSSTPNSDRLLAMLFFQLCSWNWAEEI